MKRARDITKWIAALTGATWLVWEIYVLINSESGDTFSAVLKWHAYTKPFIAAGLSLLLGHIFGPNVKSIRNNLWVVGGFMWLSICAGILANKYPSMRFLIEHNWIYLLLGVVIGAVFWSQDIDKIRKDREAEDAN